MVQLGVRGKAVALKPAKSIANMLVGVATVALLVGCDMLLEPVDGGTNVPTPTPSSAPVLPSPTSPEPIETPTPTPEPTDAGEVSVPTDDGGQSENGEGEISPETPPDDPTPEPSASPEPIPEPTEVVVPDPEPTSTPDPEIIPTPTPTPTPVPTSNISPAFSYYPPGDLEPNSGLGAKDSTIYVPDMVFPIQQARAYPQSQVYRYGGGIGGGDQCDPRNFTASWRDNFCENRSSTTTSPYCPSAGVHVGQDIRVGTPEGCRAERSLLPSERKRYVVVAAEDGYISNVGSYTVNVRSGGRIYRYMHMNMKALQVTLGQQVKAGDPIGYVSNDFGGTPTTLHLHFEIKHNTSEYGWTWAPPYTSLVKAYERREQAPGEMVIEE